MKSCREMRREALGTLRDGRWFFRLFAVALLLGGIQNLVLSLLNGFYAAKGLQTWMMFAESKAQAAASGLDLAVPSRAVAMQMNGATAFFLFLALIFYGIFVYGTSVVQLRAVRRLSGPCLRPALGGFLNPLGVGWLAFRVTAQTFLWSLLFIVPGIVAFYRYRQSFYLKADHPDWGAGRCLDESVRLMRGNKRASFAFDCSYWLPVGVLMLLVIVQTFAALTGGMAAAGLAGAVFTGAAIWVGLYYSVGQAVFFEEIRRKDAEQSQEGGVA